MTKSTKPTIKIHNAETDEVIEREMNDNEFAAYQTDQQLQAELKTKAEAKAAEKQALLDRLGITADEAQLLLGGN
jgi:hypothetical protein